MARGRKRGGGSKAASTRKTRQSKKASEDTEATEQDTKDNHNLQVAESTNNSSDNTSDSNSFNTRPKRLHKKFDRFRTLTKDNSNINSEGATEKILNSSVQDNPCVKPYSCSESEISESSRTNDDNSNSVDNSAEEPANSQYIATAESNIELEDENSQEETTVLFEIVEDIEDNSNNKTIIEYEKEFDDKQVIEVDYIDHPDVVSYEVEIEDTITVPMDVKMVVESSLFEQHEGSVQFPMSESPVDYSDSTSSDKEMSKETIVCVNVQQTAVEEQEMSENLDKGNTEHTYSAAPDTEPKTLGQENELIKILDEKINLNSTETNKNAEDVDDSSPKSVENNETPVEEKSEGANSPVIRRSSRIKTISVMKRKSKGHGLVKNDKFKRKDNASEKMQTSTSIPASSSPLDRLKPSSIKPISKEQTSEIPDAVLKPVKVKSRWRRSSELEMATPPQTNVVSSGNTSGSPTETKDSGDSEQKQETPKTEAELQFEKDMEERLRQFVQIHENEYHCERAICKEAKKMLCDCFLTEDEVTRGERGCGEDCLNRLLMIECGPNCVVGSRCTNKRFQESQYATCKVFKTEKKGFGIQATMDMAPGDFIMEYVGEVLNTEQFEKRAESYSNDKNRHYYFMALKSDTIIDATHKGNVSRFINHSCDPNAETQKWTVNGELRIGFFSKREIAEGEEITFDYQFQRYGKEAQKCYCEANNCRGWIGEEPNSDESEMSESESESEEETSAKSADEAEDDNEEKEKKPKKAADVMRSRKLTKSSTDSEEDDWCDTNKMAEGVTAEDEGGNVKQAAKKKAVRRSARRNKKTLLHRKEIFEDLDLDEEIQVLSRTGLKNQAHTLTLSRLMVRAKEIQHRAKILALIQAGEVPCRRLFLDYHGLRLVYSWMCDTTANKATTAGPDNIRPLEKEFLNLRLEILNTLFKLPIPNKTMLQDSKVLPTVEKWSRSDPIPSSASRDKGGSGASSTDSEPTTPVFIDEATGLPVEIAMSGKKDEAPDQEDHKDVKMETEEDSGKIETLKVELVPKLEDNQVKTDDTSPKFDDFLPKNESSVSSGVDAKQEDPNSDDIAIKTEDQQITDEQRELERKQAEISELAEIAELRKKLIEVAKQLLDTWKALKEVFRIPKRERIEQMKEHEREANRGYTDRSSELRYPHQSSGKYDRYKSTSSSSVGSKIDLVSTSICGGTSSRSRKSSSMSSSHMSKYERRQQFAERVAAEEEDRRNRAERVMAAARRELWSAHSNHCTLVGLNPLTTAAPDPATGLPMFYDPNAERWQAHPSVQGPVMGLDGRPLHLPHLMMPQPPPPMMMYHPQPPAAMVPGGMPVAAGYPVQGYHQPPHMMYPQQQPQQMQMMMAAGGGLPQPVQHVMAGYVYPPLPAQAVPPAPSVNDNLKREAVVKSAKKKSKVVDGEEGDEVDVSADAYKIPPPEDMPTDWMSAVDQLGRIYYYHVRKRVPQWLPPELCKSMFGRLNQFAESSSDASSDEEAPAGVPAGAAAASDSDSDNLEDTLLMRQVHGNISSTQQRPRHHKRHHHHQSKRVQIAHQPANRLERNKVVVLRAEAESTTCGDPASSSLPAVQPDDAGLDGEEADVEEDEQGSRSGPAAAPGALGLDSPLRGRPKRLRELIGHRPIDQFGSPTLNSDGSRSGDVTPQPDDNMSFGEEFGDCDSSSKTLPGEELEKPAEVEPDRKRKRRAGLVTEILISPRSEDDRLHQKLELKRYKENKERLKLKKLMKLQKEKVQADRIVRLQKEQKHQLLALSSSSPPVAVVMETSKRKSSSRDKSAQQQLQQHRHSKMAAVREKTLAADEIPFMFTLSENSKEGLRIKEQFRVDVAKVIVGQLNHFRKPDCQVGRITSTKDFKHLAKKLTHFVMVKELKHCKAVEELTFNDSVKVKAREFVKKYMAKYGEVYVRPPQEVD